MRRKKLILIFAAVFLLVAISPFLLSAHIKAESKPWIATKAEAAGFKADCIMVLGAGLKSDGTPSDMLKDRLTKGISLYKAGVAPKILLTGDNGQEEYDEVNAMKDYALQENVPAEDIFMDHAGFSTYESMYRARDVFKAEKIIIVTQKYHQYRAIYIAKKLGLHCLGIVSEPRIYRGQNYREAREIIARTKDFFNVELELPPTYLGDPIPISGSGIPSHD